MSSLPYVNDAAAGITAGYGAFNQVSRAIKGNDKRTRFVRNGSDLVQFDAVLNEEHAFRAEATSFPVQYGSNISDFISVAPTTLRIQALVTDTPLSTKDEFVQQAIIASANMVANQLASGLGVVGVAAAAMALKAQNGSTSRCVAAFNAVSQLCAGGTRASQQGTQILYPQPFDVKTYLRTYNSMVLTSVAVARDSSTGSGIVFAMELVEVRVVSSSEQDAAVLAQPDRASAKALKAEQDAEQLKSHNLFSDGVQFTDDKAGQAVVNYANGLK